MTKNFYIIIQGYYNGGCRLIQKTFRTKNNIKKESRIYTIKEYKSGDIITMQKCRFVLNGSLCVIK